jgi:hypothetical protein
MRYLIFIFLFLVGEVYSQSPLCASRPTSFCCEYVSGVTINGRTYKGSPGFSNTSGGSPAGNYDNAYTTTQFQELKPGKTFLFHIPGLQMVIIWNTLNFGLTLMGMGF